MNVDLVSVWQTQFLLHKKSSFSLKIYSVNVAKSQDLVTFTEGILNGKLEFCSAFSLCSLYLVHFPILWGLPVLHSFIGHGRNLDSRSEHLEKHSILDVLQGSEYTSPAHVQILLLLEAYNNENLWQQSCQKPSSTGVVIKSCFENMQQIYGRIPMRKCDFNKIANNFIETTLTHGSSSVFCKLAAFMISEYLFLKTPIESYFYPDRK